MRICTNRQLLYVLDEVNCKAVIFDSLQLDVIIYLQLKIYAIVAAKGRQIMFINNNSLPNICKKEGKTDMLKALFLRKYFS